jgi:zinc protease
MREALKEFEKNGVSDDDVQKFKAQYESRTINSLASVSNKVAQLAAYETFTGNPNLLKKELKKYTSITKEDVMRVYNKYIKGKFAVYQSVLPTTMKGMAAKKDNYQPQTSGKNPFPTTNYKGLTYKRPKDNFDRSKKPVPAQAPLVDVPKFWRAEVNGIKVIGTKSDEIPTVTLRLTIKGGQKLDAKDLNKVGLASLTAAMMNEGTQKYTATEVSEELRKLGSSISFFSNDDNTVVQVNTLKKNLPATLKVLEEKLLRPRFDERDFKRIKKQAIEGAKAAVKQPQSIANNVYRKLLYTEKDVRRYPVSGTEKTLLNIKLDDVKKFYKDNYSPTVAQLVVVGDIDEKDIMEDLKFLDKWEKKKVKIDKLPKPAKVDQTKIYMVDKQSAPQSEIRIGYMTNMKYDATGEYFKSYLMNYPLGGAFNSRINLNLREDKGYTYGARSYFSSDEDAGPFTATAGVRANVTDSSVIEFMKEIKGYNKGGITTEELEFMKKSIGQRDARSYETPFQKASFLNRILTYGLDKNFVKKQKKIIDKIKKKEINALIKKHINPKKMNILVVGDKATIEPGLKKIGYEVVELDANGKKVDKKAKKESEAGGKKKD